MLSCMTRISSNKIIEYINMWWSMNHEEIGVVVICREYGHWCLGLWVNFMVRMIVRMFLLSNEKWEKKYKAIRSYNPPINEDKMNLWITNIIIVVLVVDLGWLN